MWQHYSYSPDKCLPEPLEDQDAVPSLVLQLAVSQLRSLREGVSLASLVSEEAAQAPWPEEFDVVVDGRPSRIPISELPSPSLTPSPRRLPKTSSSKESGQVRNPNGTFGALEGGPE